MMKIDQQTLESLEDFEDVTDLHLAFSDSRNKKAMPWSKVKKRGAGGNGMYCKTCHQFHDTRECLQPKSRVGGHDDPYCGKKRRKLFSQKELDDLSDLLQNATKRGRPKVHPSNAARQKAYRRRAKEK